MIHDINKLMKDHFCTEIEPDLRRIISQQKVEIKKLQDKVKRLERKPQDGSGNRVSRISDFADGRTTLPGGAASRASK